MEGFSIRNTNKKIEPFARIENRGRNRMERNAKERTPRPKIDQRNNRDTNITNNSNKNTIR